MKQPGKHLCRRNGSKKNSAVWYTQLESGQLWQAKTWKTHVVFFGNAHGNRINKANTCYVRSLKFWEDAERHTCNVPTSQRWTESHFITPHMLALQSGLKPNHRKTSRCYVKWTETSRVVLFDSAVGAHFPLPKNPFTGGMEVHRYVTWIQRMQFYSSWCLYWVINRIAKARNISKKTSDRM